jgi:tripartite-type tricarboxylate transporter receptor subunit TctC
MSRASIILAAVLAVTVTAREEAFAELLSSRPITVVIPFTPGASSDTAGRVDFFFVSYSSLLPFLQGGKVRAIAVTSAKRLPVLPDAPTMTESGFAGIALDVWFGLVAPAGTPDAVIGKLNSAFVQAMRDPQIVRQMTDQGAEAAATTPAEFAAFIASETERFGKVVRAVGAKAE